MRNKKQQRLYQLNLLRRHQSSLKRKGKKCNLPFDINYKVKYYSMPQFMRTRRPKVTVPSVFSFKDNLAQLLQFINSVYNEYKNNILKRDLFFNMQSVNQIDLTAICMLLSLINKLSRKNISCYGNYPLSLNQKRYLVNSGFLDIVKTNKESRKLRETSEFENHAYLIGQGHLKPADIGRIIKKVVKSIVGVEANYKPLYSILIEICANSVEHANMQDVEKNWLVSVSYEDSKVVFHATDSGQGILGTLRKKNVEKIKDWFTMKNDGEIIKEVFSKHYLSATGDKNRHKGLPCIKETFDKGYISSLTVLTNMVYYQFETNSYALLNYPYYGTLYYWEVTLNNILKYAEYDKSQCCG
jgi:hypothetical protein